MSACLWTLGEPTELPAESNYPKEIAQLASKIESKPNAEMNFKSHKQLPRPTSTPNALAYQSEAKPIENLFMASFVLAPICIRGMRPKWNPVNLHAQIVSIVAVSDV